MNHIYIFKSDNIADSYGIGTHVACLIKSLQRSNYQFSVITYNSSIEDIKVIQKKGYQEINIPNISPFCTSSIKQSGELYFRNVCYLLSEFISNECNNIFHLNYFSNNVLAKYLKVHFPKCKILLTIHYKNWNFELVGNSCVLQKIIKKSKDITVNLEPFEQAVINGINKEKETLKFSDKVICLSRSSQVQIADIYEFEKNKTVIIRNGIPDSYVKLSEDQKSELRAKFKIGRDVNLILYVGRLEVGKGIDFLLNAFKQLLDSMPNSVLVIVGSGDYDKYLSFCNPIWNKVMFTGFLDKQSLYELYLVADIGVVPSLHEECGYVGIEMAMFQLPLIISDSAGLAEVFEHDISCLKVPIQYDQENIVVDNYRLVSVIKEFLCNKNLADSISENGRQIFLEQLEFSNFMDRINKLYDSIFNTFDSL